MAYTKEPRVGNLPPILGKTTFKDKCSILRTTLFPTPPLASPINWDSYIASPTEWPNLTLGELRVACLPKLKGKTLGPDAITPLIVAHALEATPNTFLRLYSCLINIGYYPTPWKEAIGVILKKPNKPDYAIPKAYRVISLLNCLRKVAERVLA